jgi:RHS repeat-associated protein
VQRYEYDAFGNIVSMLDPDFIQPYTYTGREYDPESGLYFYRARYYDETVGRFISEDPIGIRGGINFYSYTHNNPINRIDPMGLDDGWPWYGGWPWNGNTFPGYHAQDNKCSDLAAGFNKNPCTKKCCEKHDECYKRFGCNESSWLSPFPVIGACQLCNWQVSACLLLNEGKSCCK